MSPTTGLVLTPARTVRHLCDEELNERLTQTCELELRSLCLYLCFSKSVAAWLCTGGPGTSWATPAPVLTSSWAPSCTLQLCTDEQPVNSSSYEIRAELVLRKILYVEVIDPSSTDWARAAGRDSCLLQTKKSVSRLLGSRCLCCECCRECLRAGLPVALQESGPIHRHREPFLMISKSKARSDNARRECCGYHRTVTRETWKLKCVSLRLRCVYTHCR